ncbi:MAG: hypothetical protein ACTHKT_14295, partial [Solirubrobacterales bacterium]
MSDDGTHVFFETTEALSPADTDGVNDIYEWTEGNPAASLLSSGRSVEYMPLVPSPRPTAPNLLLSVTPSGGDVVFLTPEALVPGAGEGGAQAIYDARVDGGFPEPPLPPTPCAEEGCHHVPTSTLPFFPSPRSKSTLGKGNLKHKRMHRHHKKSHHKKNHQHKRRLAAKISAAPEAPAASASPGPSTDRGAIQTQQSSLSANPTASALEGSFESFGIESLSGSFSTTAAAEHPDFTTNFSLTHAILEGKAWSDAHAEEITVSLPPGLLGNPNAFPRCSTGDFVAYNNCPLESQVGIARAVITGQPGIGTFPIYNLAPPHPKQELARLGFFPVLAPVFIDIKVRTASDYGVTATVHTPPAASGVLASETILWGNPSDESHDPLRLFAYEGAICVSGTACNAPEGKREVPRDNQAFISNPSACGQGTLGLSVTSYQLPGKVFSASAPLPAITNCQGLPFAPSFSATPTSHEAGAPTGLQTKLTLPQHSGANEPATATMREARVTLPAGMQVNPDAANWIEACSEAQVGYRQEVDARCPDGSKLGTARIVSPDLPEAIEGNLYQRTPAPGHQLGLWLVADQLGLHVKLPGELEPDKQTGRLTAVFKDLPQVPVEEIELNVWGGPRAPLTNPPSCGTYATDFSFAPRSDDPAVTGQAPMVINEGCNQPFDPKLDAGTTKPVAG